MAHIPEISEISEILKGNCILLVQLPCQKWKSPCQRSHSCRYYKHNQVVVSPLAPVVGLGKGEFMFLPESVGKFRAQQIIAELCEAHQKNMPDGEYKATCKLENGYYVTHIIRTDKPKLKWWGKLWKKKQK